MSVAGANVSTDATPEPDRACRKCARLAAYLAHYRQEAPDWYNAPVRSFGADDAQLLIVGLAPGLRGANRTGRPFTGDYAGDLLYQTLVGFGFAEGAYRADPEDGLTLRACMITNAVRCVPPENKPTPLEIATCRPYLVARIAALPRLRVVLALGRVAHESTLRALGQKLARYPFAHGSQHDLDGSLALFDSYHCSRYNTNTGRLTPAMFTAVFAAIKRHLERPPAVP